MERLAREIEPAMIAAARAIEGGRQRISVDRAIGVAADVAAGERGGEAAQSGDPGNDADNPAPVAAALP